MTRKTEFLEACWKEEDVIGGRRVDALVIIFRTTGCWWYHRSGCLMCGYNLASTQGIGLHQLERQLERALERYDGEEMLKVYTSGSFLDPEEIPVPFRESLFSAFDSSERILLESRPEFVRRGNFDGIDVERSQLAIGLESASDEIRSACINKGFDLEEYLRAADLLERLEVPLRTYLLLKPPFLGEREAIRDTVSSMKLATSRSESVSINPLNVQKGTLVDRIWRRGEFRPPWWWSLIEVLRSAPSDGGRVISAPSGGGTPRGIHNCGRCDPELKASVQRFSLSQDPKDLDGVECDCWGEWSSVLNCEEYACTSVDVAKYLDQFGFLA
ncbi:MAG: archaeosine biosynthesis radical SAM protein RaSEA [Methanomassiliicoccales archaeon]